MSAKAGQDPPVKASKPRARLWTVVQLVVMAAAIAVLLAWIDLDRIRPYLSRVPVATVVFCVGLGLVRIWLLGERWALLNEDVARRLTKWDYFRYTMVGSTFTTILPGLLGGDVARGVLVARDLPADRGANLFAILADRVVGLASVLTLGVLATLLAPGLENRLVFLLPLLAVLTLFVAGVALAGSERLLGWIHDRLQGGGRVARWLDALLRAWRRALVWYRAHPRNVLLAFLLCLPIHGLYFFGVYLLALDAGLDVDFLTVSTITALVWMIAVIPISPSGLGVRELSFVALFSLQGHPVEPVAALTCFLLVIQAILALLGVPFLFLSRKRAVAPGPSPTS